jgi:hypothetical protein
MTFYVHNLFYYAPFTDPKTTRQFLLYFTLGACIMYEHQPPSTVIDYSQPSRDSHHPPWQAMEGLTQVIDTSIENEANPTLLALPHLERVENFLTTQHSETAKLISLIATLVSIFESPPPPGTFPFKF